MNVAFSTFVLFYFSQLLGMSPSLAGTAQSNVTVGPPFELALYPRDTLAVSHHLSVEADAPYLTQLRQRWDEGFRRTLNELPLFDWEK